jgi:plastocyanin
MRRGGVLVVVNIDRNLARRAAAAAAALVLTLAACGGGDDDAGDSSAPAATAGAGGETAASGDSVIEISGFAFSGVTSVPAGTVLTIANNDTAPHTFTADDGSFDTGTIQPGATAEITLATAGTFAYHCDIHASMTGSITVT